MQAVLNSFNVSVLSSVRVYYFANDISEVIGNFLLEGEVLDRLAASIKLRQIEFSRGLVVCVGIKECSISGERVL